MIKTVLTYIMMGATSAYAADALTLDDCFHMAVNRSETLQIKDEAVNQAAARFRQVLGGVLPQLSFKASNLIQDVPASDQAANAGSISTTFLRRNTPNTAINMTQAIFSGFKEFRAMASGKAAQARSQHDRNWAAQLLYQDVAQSFYAVIQLQNDVGILNRLRQTTVKRVAELRERATLGRSRASEVSAAEAQEANVAAMLEESRGLLQVAREMLEFLTGIGSDVALRDGRATHAPVESLTLRAPEREDILAAQEAIKEARGNLGVAKSYHYPTITMSANYYPYRVGFYDPIKWDTTFYLTVPIFSGGTTTAQIQEAKSKLMASELNEQLTRRQSEKDIKSAHATWKSALTQAQAYARAARKNRENYLLQAQDYQTSLVSNLEVLQALNSWMDSERKANQLHNQAKLNQVQLEVASGLVPTPGKTK